MLKMVPVARRTGGFPFLLPTMAAMLQAISRSDSAAIASTSSQSTGWGPSFPLPFFVVRATISVSLGIGSPRGPRVSSGS